MYLFNKATKKGYFKGCWKIEKEHFKGSLSRSIVRCIIRFIVLMILFPVALGDFIVRKCCRFTMLLNIAQTMSAKCKIM